MGIAPEESKKNKIKGNTNGYGAYLGFFSVPLQYFFYINYAGDKPFH